MEIKGQGAAGTPGARIHAGHAASERAKTPDQATAGAAIARDTFEKLRAGSIFHSAEGLLSGRGEPPPQPLQDSAGRLRDLLGIPGRSGVNAEFPEVPEEDTPTCPTPDEGGGYTGPPTRGEGKHGIGLHGQPTAAPFDYTPGEPLLAGDDLLDANALRIPREQKPRPNVNPGLDLGAATIMDALAFSPNAGGVGGQGSPPSPPPRPDRSQSSGDFGHEGGHVPKPPKDLE